MFGEVEPAGRDVGGDQRRHLACLEVRERLLAGGLCLVAVHRHRAHLMALEALGEPVGTTFGADEDERKPPLFLQQLDELVHLVVGRHRATNWWSISPGRCSLGSSAAIRTGCVRVGARELADGAVERGREEHRLTLVRDAPEDLVHLRFEAHVEHPVGLVENEDP